MGFTRYRQSPMQPALTCMIIDDDICSIDLLRHFAERSGQIHLAGTQTNPFQALEVLESRPVDFLLLDVEMPGMNGLELMHQLSSPPKVILCTGYGRFALSGFEIEAIDFLLKPITYPRFCGPYIAYPAPSIGRLTQGDD